MGIRSSKPEVEFKVNDENPVAIETNIYMNNFLNNNGSNASLICLFDIYYWQEDLKKQTKTTITLTFPIPHSHEIVTKKSQVEKYTIVKLTVDDSYNQTNTHFPLKYGYREEMILAILQFIDNATEDSLIPFKKYLWWDHIENYTECVDLFPEKCGIWIVIRDTIRTRIENSIRSKPEPAPAPETPP